MPLYVQDSLLGETLTHSIYALIDPCTDQVRYVGQTMDEPECALGRHLYEARNWAHSKKQRWIRDLLARDMTPKVVRLDKCCFEDVKQRERLWIEYYRTVNPDAMCNIRGGGEGVRRR